MFDVFGLTFFHHQHRPLTEGKFAYLFRYQRVGHVEHQQRNLAVSKSVGQAKRLQRTHQAVVKPALNDDAQLRARAFQQVIKLVLQDVAACSREPLVNFELFLSEGHRWVGQLHVVEGAWLGHKVLGGNGGQLVVFALKTAPYMAGADAQFHHGGHVGGFRKPKTMFHQIHHARQIRAGVEQHHARFLGISVAALLNHAGTFAVVFTQHNQNAAGHPG